MIISIIFLFFLPVDPYSYTCNGTYSTLTLLTDFFTNNNVNVTDIVVGESCYGTEEGDDYVFYDCPGDDAVSAVSIVTTLYVSRCFHSYNAVCFALFP